MVADWAGNPYDDVPYPALTFRQTHPASLQVLANLRGMRAPPADQCRVLELGCGRGANLIPMAYQYPGSTFVGLDLSAHAIGIGTRLVTGLDLRNITLLHQDIMAFGRSDAPFDYIIAHGLYSWVPPRVRTRIMELIADNLAPQGIGYVSYNCLPRCQLRNIGRDLMRFHVRDIADPGERVRQARAILSVMSGMAADESDLYTFVLRDLANYADQRPDEVLYHDDLAEIATPFLFEEVMREAEACGLQYLCEASSPEFEGLSDATRDFLGRFPDEDIVRREQYRDFIVGRGFRETLLCHRTVSLKRTVDPGEIESYLISAPVKPMAPSVDPAARDMLEFKSHGGVRIVTDHPLSKAALLHLGEIWPQELSFEELVPQAIGRVGAAGGAIAANLKAEAEALARTLSRAFAAQVVVLRGSPAPFTVAIGERPKASLLARHQAAAGDPVTTMAHGTIALRDPYVSQFLQLLDGTRTVDDIVRDLQLRSAAMNAPAAGEAGSVPGAGPGAGWVPGTDVVTREQVERNLRLVSQLALLVE